MVNDRPGRTPGRVALAAVSPAPLDVAACLAAVDDPAAGGLGVFVGVVRDRDGDRDVSGLAYSAHPSAEAELLAVCELAARRPGVTAVAAIHRVGELRVGDPAVVVAVSAPHRAEALDTTRWLIDALKQTVPIWKHQRFADGGEEWVGSP